MGARIRKLAVFLGCFCRRLRRGCQLPRRRLSEMAAGDSRSEALEWQPRFLRPKELRHGTESRCASGSGGYLHLALRAEKNASLPQPLGPDGCATGPTGLAVTAVDVEGQLKIPRFATAVAVVAQGGATGPDS